MDAKELKPCPFCGGKPEMYYPFHLMGKPGHAATYHGGVRCSQCGCESRATTPVDESISAWNRRDALPSDAAQAPLTDSLRTLIRDAARSVSEHADGIKAGCACGDDWPDATDKAYYDAQVAILERLRDVYAAAPVAPAAQVTDEMVSRFLGWHLPDDFAPDCGVSFKPLGHPNGWPVGTNLFTATQARAMLEHVLATQDVAPAAAAPSAFEALKAALTADKDYAWSWHCNLAMAFYDSMPQSSGRHQLANEGAARFMWAAFGIEIKAADAWKAIEREWKKGAAGAPIEHEKMMMDAVINGQGFMKDGQHVPIDQARAQPDERAAFEAWMNAPFTDEELSPADLAVGEPYSNGVGEFDGLPFMIWQAAVKWCSGRATTPQAKFECAARKQGSVGGNDPADCDWPVCGCDEHANKVIGALEESGALKSTPIYQIGANAGGGIAWWDVDKDRYEREKKAGFMKTGIVYREES